MRQERLVTFERSKTLELVAWLTEHRERPTRAGARAALWELDVRDATFANVVSEARRALARHLAPPAGEEWVARTLTERLPLHELVVSDADLVRARLNAARVAPPQEAIDILRPAVGIDPGDAVRRHRLSVARSRRESRRTWCCWPRRPPPSWRRTTCRVGDVDGVFWATGRGLHVLPGHEELIALRMRAHHRAGDLAGVRQEWESYERVLDGDSWGEGEPAPKLVDLRRQLLDTQASW